MKNSTKFTLLSLVAFSAASISLAAVTISNNNVINANADSEVITTVDLDAVALNKDLTQPLHDSNNERYDQLFTIALENEKYIDGALLFNDCGRQFIGDTLAEPFGLVNNDSNANNYDFNFFFETVGCRSMEVTLTFSINELVPGGVHSLQILRSASIDGSFVSNIPTEEKYRSFTYYEYDVFGKYDEVEAYESNPYLFINEKTTTVTRSFTRTKTSSNLFNLHLEGLQVPAGRTVTITIDSLKLTYDCGK